MRRKHTLIVVSIAVAITAVVVVSAGDPDSPPGPPETTSSYTLEHIYDRLDTGVASIPITFTEPSSGPPTGTMHTLDEIYDLIGERAPVPKTGQTECYYDDETTGTCTCGDRFRGGRTCPRDACSVPLLQAASTAQTVCAVGGCADHFRADKDGAAAPGQTWALQRRNLVLGGRSRGRCATTAT